MTTQGSSRACKTLSLAEEDEVNIEIPAGLTPDNFEVYSAIDNNAPVAADNTDAEILASMQAEVENDDSDDENPPTAEGGVNDPSPIATFSDAIRSISVLRSYMEANGCQNYEQLYSLTGQIYDINKANSVQKTIKDFFAPDKL